MCCLNRPSDNASLGLPWDSDGNESAVIRESVSSVQSFSRFRLFANPWTVVRQDSLFITTSRSLLKLMSIKSVMPSNQLILCHPLLLPPSIFPSIRVFPSIRIFSSESVLRIRWQCRIPGFNPPSRENPLEKGMANHTSLLAWRIPWTEEPSGLQSMGLQRVGHD